MLGAQIDGPEQREFNGLKVDLWPRISWSPLFAISFAELEVPALPHTACSLDPQIAQNPQDVRIRCCRGSANTFIKRLLTSMPSDAHPATATASLIMGRLVHGSREGDCTGAC